MEREAAYNAASDALDELINADTNRRRELEDAFAKADSERETASVTWENAKVTFNKARADYERSIAEWEQIRANWQKSRDALEEFNRAGNSGAGSQPRTGAVSGNTPFPSRAGGQAMTGGATGNTLTPFPRR
jgi:hypothetical protein